MNWVKLLFRHGANQVQNLTHLCSCQVLWEANVTLTKQFDELSLDLVL